MAPVIKELSGRVWLPSVLGGRTVKKEMQRKTVNVLKVVCSGHIYDNGGGTEARVSNIWQGDG